MRICGQDPSAARLTIATNFEGPGAYMQCVNKYQYDKVDPRFFYNHPNLKWIMTNLTQYLRVDGALRTGSMYVGRINVTTSKGTFQQIGKIIGGYIYYRHPETLKQIIFRGPYEILACTPCSYQPKPGEPCCKIIISLIIYSLLKF